MKIKVEKVKKNLVYIVFGGCWGDEEIISVHDNKEEAEARAEKENREYRGIDAYVRTWIVNGEEI